MTGWQLIVNAGEYVVILQGSRMNPGVSFNSPLGRIHEPMGIMCARRACLSAPLAITINRGSIAINPESVVTDAPGIAEIPRLY
jgi:hypothetical protein